MSDRPEPGPEGQFDGQDVDFGMFHANQYASYAPWTQFSGIPTTPTGEDAASFGWEHFMTPPNTPAADFQQDLTNPLYLAELNNMMNAMGKSNAANFDSNADDTDKLASTPVAQSLLEALQAGNAPLGTGQEEFANGLDIDMAAQDGYDMYAEALKKFGTDYQSYTPFGTADVLNASPSSTPPLKDWNNFHQQNSKPSYSDVAKTLKSSQGSEKEEVGVSKKKSTEAGSTRALKGGKKFVARQVKSRVADEPEVITPMVSPDSKYGLDDFTDVGKSKSDKEETGAGLGSIPLLARHNSTSSLSSGTSGIEEIHLTKTCNNYSNVAEETHKFEKISNKEKEKTLDEKAKNASKSEKPFFDARRIFQTKDTNRRQTGGHNKSGEESAGPTILNNGKPSSSYNTWCPPKKSTAYINNNLRDSQKKTNQNPGGKEAAATETDFAQCQGRTEKKGRCPGSKQSSSKPKMPLQTSFDHELIDEWLSFLYDKAKLCLHQLWTLILMVILLIFSIIVYLVSGCVHLISWVWSRLWTLLETRVFKGSMFGGSRFRSKPAETPKKIGLEENIALPSTGDEAMQRLLACKGKDPYSILGLKWNATDEDVKKYYRRQAVLVHPDKNQQPGAEEAFKILGHAFDLIGDASKRQAYDRQLQEAKEAEAAMHEFNDLLTKLQEKIQQASNMMRCDNCGGKHKRCPVQRPWYSARYCDRCSIRHSAKEGDVWAETSMLGFLWHYYACMEGKVYDITEWVACKKEFFKHMQANAHHVFYRIATERNRSHNRRAANTGPSAKILFECPESSDADLEDFISHLFHEAMNNETGGGAGPAGPGSSSWQPPPGTAGQAWNSTAGTQRGAPPSAAGKRQRKKKRKH